MKYTWSYIFVLFVLAPVISMSQAMPVNDQQSVSRYPFISTVFNRVFNNAGLDSFYHKLHQLKTTRSGVVRIVHIGDSHIQADFLSSVVRNNLQSFAGNAGRGLVFPYQLAQSNAPPDIISSSNTRWQFNRLAHPELPLAPGISGFVISSGAEAATINIALRQQDGDASFNRVRVFAGMEGSGWRMQAEAGEELQLTDAIRVGDSTIKLQRNSTRMSLIKAEGTDAVYGVSLEKDTAGVIYHSIGVNGARYDQYNNTPLFWKQLPKLAADLYIISLGTNEAQRAAFAPAFFLNELSDFINRVKSVSPSAAILITTAPDSYKGRSSNKVLRDLNKELAAYCNKNYIPVWDLYRITNGYGSAYSWARRGLMSRDRVHFTAEGYRLQGLLLYNAIAKGYNEFVKARESDQNGRSSSLLKELP